MKRVFWIFFLMVFGACNFGKSKTQDIKTVSPVGFTRINFETEVHDFGKLKSGEIVIFSFVFTNTGKEDLVIKNVKTDCGCIVTNCSNKPVKSGKTGIVEVEFNSSGLFGNQLKSIIVEANVPEPKHLAIFAEVNNENLEITY